MLDFAKYDIRDKSNDGAPFNPVLPGEDSPCEDVTIWVIGSTSDKMRKFKIQRAREQLTKQKGKRNKPENYSDEELLNMFEGDPKVVAELIVRWEGVALKGKKLECNEQNRLMLMEGWPWLRDQIDQFAARAENFLPDASNHGRSE